MAVYVQLRDHEAFASCVHDHPDTSTTIATRAGIRKQRLHQLLTGQYPSIAVDHAAALEDVLAVERGSLFTFPDQELALPYALSTPDSDGSAADAGVA